MNNISAVEETETRGNNRTGKEEISKKGGDLSLLNMTEIEMECDEREDLVEGMVLVGEENENEISVEAGVEEKDETKDDVDEMDLESGDDETKEDKEIEEEEKSSGDESEDEEDQSNGEEADQMDEADVNITKDSKKKVKRLDTLMIGNKKYSRSAFLPNKGLELADKQYKGNPKAISFQCCNLCKPHNLLKCHGLHLTSRSILLRDHAYVRLNMMEENAGKEELLRFPGRALEKSLCYLSSAKERKESAGEVASDEHNAKMCTGIHLRPGVIFVGSPLLRVAYFEEELADNWGLKKLREEREQTLSGGKNSGGIPSIGRRLGCTTTTTPSGGCSSSTGGCEASQTSPTFSYCGHWCHNTHSHIVSMCKFIHYNRGGNHYTEKGNTPGIPQPVFPEMKPKKPRTTERGRGGRGGGGRGGCGGGGRGRKGGERRGAPRLKIRIPPSLLQQPKVPVSIPMVRKDEVVSVGKKNDLQESEEEQKTLMMFLVGLLGLLAIITFLLVFRYFKSFFFLKLMKWD